jgi:hypothetical protein
MRSSRPGTFYVSTHHRGPAPLNTALAGTALSASSLEEMALMSYDENRIAEAVLALLAAYSFESGRSWKGYDFGVLDRVHEQGLLDDPKGRAKSVVLTPEGLERGLTLAQRLFGAT